nr:glycosyltransferase [Pedobacter aquae]
MSDSKRLDIAHRALQKVLKNHSSAVRAKELISYTQEAINKQSISN